MSGPWVFPFGGGKAAGGAADKALLGGKGAGLSEMVRLGLPVPPGFVITTEVCRRWMDGGAYPPELAGQVEAALAEVGAQTGAKFGDATNPLLLSVRSGAPVSMPGMMDTILNLGLNPTTVAGLARRTGNPRFAWDCYRRFIAMYGDVVLGVVAPDEHSDSPFERLLEDAKHAKGLTRDSDLDAGDLERLCAAYKDAVRAATGADFPDDPIEQLWGAIAAVFRSWGNPRAEVYRRMHDIPAAMGTAVTVQAMVFGNLGDDSGTGVCFTRDPSTGAKELYGEFLLNAQGEDVVAGIRTPEPIAGLARLLPEAHAALLDVCARLEAHYKDMQDLEFTIQDRKLWMLQSRTGKRTGRAMVKIAVDLVDERVIDEATAILRVDPAKLDELLHPTIDPRARPTPVAKGLPASPGAAIGKVVFTASQAEAAKAKGDDVILVRTETSPEDIHGMKAAVGILTARGGMTSHAAVVARGMGTCCVTGCTALRVDAARGQATFASKGGPAGDVTIKRGDVITVDGSSGEIFLGAAPLAPAEMSPELGRLMTWVDRHRKLKVRTNADTPTDARAARAFGAEGIGLCRTEHMFFQPDRILAVRQMILARDEAGRRAALTKILPMQQGDFEAIFREMDGLPVTIRLLDPPLHEFLPHTAKDIEEVARDVGATPEAIAAKVAALTEANPMLGHRGCRLAITYPEIYETQAEAIARAAVAATRAGVTVNPEIMIPFVIVPLELARLRARVAAVVDRILAEAELSLAYTIGTMIELPRACLAAGAIAAHADFFSFGTNDLTQSTLGLSRDDLASFLPAYLEQEILPKDPFVTLDADGVGQLVALAVERGRAVRPGLKVGVCGEHGGDPASVACFHGYGLDYVSCSPFRVPIARVAAAQAALRAGRS